MELNNSVKKKPFLKKNDSLKRKALLMEKKKEKYLGFIDLYKTINHFLKHRHELPEENQKLFTESMHKSYISICKKWCAVNNIELQIDLSGNPKLIYREIQN
jgi:hypothetical protein